MLLGQDSFIKVKHAWLYNKTEHHLRKLWDRQVQQPGFKQSKVRIIHFEGLDADPDVLSSAVQLSSSIGYTLSVAVKEPSGTEVRTVRTCVE